MNKPEILVIDDEEQIQKLLKITLQTNDFKVSGALTAKEGIRGAKTINPDLILLDLGLPDESGHEVLKKLRTWFTKPIIILSAQSREEDIVKALDNGANDYLVKPFRTGELLARLRSSLRGSIFGNISKPEESTDLKIDLHLRLVKKNGELLKLTATEYDLLSTFVKNEGRVLTHQYLLREVWGPGYIDQSQYLRVFINQLRKKIETEPNRPKYILTESGVGYRFVIE
ncbi:response regulator [Aurantibacillus circumpalustris]|uniref:response regulator n=1 Tax=Aurantibacillus circumpalustris TaxID=3036359 RepID=UPI00295BA35A|nr:response regulator [Aurantibacillus circumpalustris]